MPQRLLGPLAASLILSLALAAPLRPAFAQEEEAPGAVEITDEGTTPAELPEKAPPTGRKAAEKYMAPRRQAPAGNETRSRTPASTSASHYLALHVGSYVSDAAYKWGRQRHQTDVGNWNLGLTYRLGEWVNAADFDIRIDFSSFELAAGRATKMSFVPLIVFPDASSRFPLYFGAGLGAGVFIKQIDGESPLALEYQALLGARFFDVFENTGFFLEGGIKNHLHLVSDGQFNGTFVALGAVFTF